MRFIFFINLWTGTARWWRAFWGGAGMAAWAIRSMWGRSDACAFRGHSGRAGEDTDDQRRVGHGAERSELCGLDRVVAGNNAVTLQATDYGDNAGTPLNRTVTVLGG